MIATTTHSVSPTTSLSRFFKFPSFFALEKAHRDLKKFKALDDYQLADMGITREQQVAATLEDFLHKV